ncbi:MAG: hypothetical protein Q4D79_09215 [Propionibacteriaceae bacterium]|nr:hypothetical protein [Propionibacteriaceae bacterium]
MLNRRSFITISAAGLGAAGIMTPVLAVAQDSPSGDLGAEIQIGPVAVLSGKTVLRVAATEDDFEVFLENGAFTMGSAGPVPAGIRLLSQTRGVAFAPDADQLPVRSLNPSKLLETYAVFEPIEGSSPVEVRLPGYAIIPGVPVVSADQAPFAPA